MIDPHYVYQAFKGVNSSSIWVFIAIIILLWLIVSMLRRFSCWFSNKFPQKRMSVFAWVPVISFLFYLIGIFIAFCVIFQPSHEFIIVITVSAIVTFSFAGKDIITSILGGIVLLMDKSFQLGDRITFKEHRGEVIEIGFRSTKLLTIDENVVTIPNHLFLSDVVTSNNAGQIDMMATVDLYVPIESDLDKVKKIIHEELQKNRYVESDSKIIIVAKEVLAGSGAVILMLTVECIIKDIRFEKEFQTDFYFSAIKRLRAQTSAN